MNANKLLSRDAFREGVFARDQHRCVICQRPAVDAHHIIERRLFSDGGYYMNNGASVCQEHHIACEQTTISTEDIAAACGIKKLVLPEHMYDDQAYDKWGNPVLASGMRLKGDLFFDESVQKILAQGQVLHLFSDWVKYPRTHHLPWSQGMHGDDRLMKSLAAFEGQRVIVTEKMDGENTSMYCDYLHARSVDGRGHPSRDWVKQFWARICYDIPKGWRVCGENLFAKHSISYEALPTYFMGFSIWNERNVCLGWDETLEFFELLGITPVPTLYDGIFDAKKIESLWSQRQWGTSEGYVVRLAQEIPFGDFRNKFGKFVRKDHVQTIKHWMHGQAIVRNGLAHGDW